MSLAGLALALAWLSLEGTEGCWATLVEAPWQVCELRKGSCCQCFTLLLLYYLDACCLSLAAHEWMIGMAVGYVVLLNTGRWGAC